MSHYSGHIQSGPQVPQARVAFFGVSLVAVGLLGFYTHIQRKHERKHAFDRAHQDRARVSSWEHRMIQRNQPVPSSDSRAILRASRIESRSTPLSPPTSTHNGQHRTVGEDSASTAAVLASSTFDMPPSTVDESGRPLAYNQPTAQKGHSDGRAGVYTKNPGWREQAHYATGGKTPSMGPGDGTVDGELEKMQDVAESVEKKVKSIFGK
ncbi:hypothetical protein ACEPAI_9802 [Sanghuangporus weigelae]